jgi:hypothetical protein
MTDRVEPLLHQTATDARCPRCHAGAGEPCTRAAARGTARYMIGSGGVPLKRPHRE